MSHVETELEIMDIAHRNNDLCPDSALKYISHADGVVIVFDVSADGLKLGLK